MLAFFNFPSKLFMELLLTNPLHTSISHSPNQNISLSHAKKIIFGAIETIASRNISNEIFSNVRLIDGTLNSVITAGFTIFGLDFQKP